jgi:type I restriction enzyme S subunit
MSKLSKIPPGWIACSVGSIADLINGHVFKSTDWRRIGTPIIRIQNLNNPKAPFNYFDGMLPDRFRVRTGDLLFAWSGTPGTSFGAHIWSGGEAWLNQHIFKVVFDEQYLDKYYFRLALNRNVAGYILQSSGGSGLAHVRKEQVLKSTILLPPLNEQRRIAGAVKVHFDRLDATAEDLRNSSAKLTKFRSTVLKVACVGTQTSKLKRRKATLEKLGELFSGQSPPSDAVNFSGKGTIYVSGPEQWDGQKIIVNKWTTSPRRVVPKGCVFITVKGAGVGTVFPGIAAAIGRDIYAFKPNSSVTAKFLELLLQFTAEDVISRAHGDIPGLTRHDLLNHTLLIPSRAEQVRISKRVKKQMTFADRAEEVITRSLARTEEIRNSIVSKALDGNLVHHQSDAAPIEMLVLKLQGYLKKTLVKKKEEIYTVRRSLRGRSKSTMRQSLISILEKSPRGITPEDLFYQAGFGPDNVDEFYRELAGRIKDIEEIRPPSTKDWPTKRKILVRLKTN